MPSLFFHKFLQACIHSFLILIRHGAVTINVGFYPVSAMIISSGMTSPYFRDEYHTQYKVLYKCCI